MGTQPDVQVAGPLQSLQEPGVKAIGVVGNRGEHQFADEVRVLDGDLQSDTGPHAISEKVGLFDPDLAQQGLQRPPCDASLL